jgi:hypothetical protein
VLEKKGKVWSRDGRGLDERDGLDDGHLHVRVLCVSSPVPQSSKAERQGMTTERDYSSAWQAEAASKKEFPPSVSVFPPRI